MADFKLTVIFGAQAGGWTESWILTALDFADAAAKVEQYTDARARLLGQGAFIDATRLVNVLSPGQSDFKEVPPDYTTARAYPTVRDTLQTVVTIRLQSTTGARRMFQLSGVPDNLIFFDAAAGAMVFDDVYRTRMVQFVNSIVAIPVRVFAISKDPPVVNLKLIQKAEAVLAGSFTITSVAHGYAVNDVVRLSRVPLPAKPQITGVWTISSVTADTFTIITPLITDAFSQGRGGIIRRQVRGYESIVNGSPLRVSNRKRGRAFFLPVGRQRGR